jgi:5-(hydroxymethyl)furfural/furfural oxidase
VMGGGSSINGQLANRGGAGDYDEWESLGAARLVVGRRCCPTSRRSSATWTSPGRCMARTGGSWCGGSFRTPGRRRPCSMARPSRRRGGSIWRTRTGSSATGIFRSPRPTSMSGGVSAATGYLGPSVRLRANLTIQGDTRVKELLFEDRVCVGVRAVHQGREQVFRGGRRRSFPAARSIRRRCCCGRGSGRRGICRDVGVPCGTRWPGSGSG